MKLLTKAIAFASRKHEGQKRKGTDIPYIVHPLEALSIASTLTNDENVLAAAVLHDVVEDCGVSLRDIKFRFGKEVARLVAADTENKRENETAESTWKVRKQETLNHIEKMDKNSKIVVLADKLSNMRAIYRDYDNLGDSLWQKFNCKDKKEQKWYYEQIGYKLGHDFIHTEAYYEYWQLLHIVFNENKWYETLIKKEFIDYFSNEQNSFYKVVEDKIIKDDIFQNFSDVVSGITMAHSHVRCGFADRYSEDNYFSKISPYMYFGFRVACDGLIREQKTFEKILNLQRGSSITSLYELDPMSLSADQLAILILYPFWSRMGGSFETTFLDNGRLKKYLLALKKKHLEETKKDSDNKN